MNKVIIYQPGKLVFGEGTLDQFLTDYLSLGLKKMYLLTITPVESLLVSVLKTLTEEGVDIKVNTEVLNEPSFADFEKILKDARAFGADSVVGIGGGSVMDVAKLLAAQLQSDQDTREIIGNGLLKGRSTYLACLPTTSGTGSEVSPNAIFLDEMDGGKKGVISPFLVPDGAYIDPSLSVGVPSAVTAATGIDALTHCLEAYTNKFSHPMVDLFALEGIRLIGNYIKRACKDGQDLEARTMLALGSVYGGMCLGPVNTAAVHALAYPLGSDFKVPHGLSNALLLPYVMEYNLESGVEKFAQIARVLGAKEGSDAKETAINGVSKIKEIMKECDIPERLSDINIPEDAIESMAKGAFEVKRLLNNNIKELKLEDIVDIYKKAY
ncbi:iron-containing alcohol dehydrogenase [Plebeiibacterium sediminum]|uniref:Iron-containing alcohol dehydrogenase n=1 Tax=Plebeiibacterium sediminum TaxID=2992112 RepID=A0AAE3M389_9BACT|nr:iron-containing alcohol dehydrogenase [Plebeiobacterium sediminum]MCW3785950.1 iron-containing alcohol dehydrogenase [Plebeiobacterium sediminum]